MSKQKYKKAESLLIDYLSGSLGEQLEKRRLELKYPPKKSSKSDLREVSIDPMAHTNKQGSALESDVLTYVDDGTYTFLKAQIHRIEKCLEFIKSVDETDFKILVYFYRDNKSWVCVSQKVHLSVRQCIRRRDKSIKELTKWI